MKADPFAQLKLLDLQACDSAMDQLRYRENNLPEHQKLVQLQSEHAAAKARAAQLRTVIGDLTAEQQRIDAEVEGVKTRRDRDQERIDKGLVGNPKELGHLQDELVSLQRRITSLEDSELEIMEKLEEGTRQLEEAEEQAASISAEGMSQVAERDRIVTEIRKELAAATETRRGLVADLPADLLEVYERLRAQKDGIGAALLRARQCGGCQLGLDAAELAKIRSAPVDEVVRCEECSRILVRTGESGLN